MTLKESKRQRIVDAATMLFAREGYHHTGIDTILECAGVSKRTLYHHFRSKDELILAVLRHYDSVFRNDFIRRVEAAAETPRERLLAIFEVGEDWFSDDSFYGCMFIKAVGEFSDKDSPIRRVCQEFKALLRDYLEKLSRDAGAHEPADLADAIALLFEGAIVTAQVSGDPVAARTAQRAARLLIDDALAAQH